MTVLPLLLAALPAGARVTEAGASVAAASTCLGAACSNSLHLSGRCITSQFIFSSLIIITTGGGSGTYRRQDRNIDLPAVPWCAVISPEQLSDVEADSPPRNLSS